LTREADVQAAGELGADAIGLVFYQPSPRAVTIDQAQRLMQAVPPFVTTVGLFVNAEPAFVNEVLSRLPLDALQFHGDEPPGYCASFHRPWLKALRVRKELDVAAAADRYQGAAGLLLDTFDPQVAGGSGRRFDWGLVPRAMAGAVILAGGLTPENVGEAVVRVRPYAVDVSGGVEAAKGIKDRAKMSAFLQAVRDGDDEAR
jgi:phosphoribosylanthranilate isomerase